MKRYDVYRITEPGYEDGLFERGPVAVFETYWDEQKAWERAENLNDGQGEDKERFVAFEVRERGYGETLAKYDVCAVLSPYFEDKYTGTDTFRYETGCETREAAERRARELNDERSLSEKKDLIYEVRERVGLSRPRRRVGTAPSPTPGAHEKGLVVAFVRKKCVGEHAYYQVVESRGIKRRARKEVLLHLRRFPTVEEALDTEYFGTTSVFPTAGASDRGYSCVALVT